MSIHTISRSPNLETVRIHLAAQRDDFQRLGALVKGDALLTEVLELLTPLLGVPEPTYALVDAAKATGFTADYIGRLVRSGALRNHGRRGAPRVRLSECPVRRLSS